MLEKKENQVLEAIKRGDPKVLERLYDEIRQPFLVWAVQFYQCEDEDAIEIYQKAYTILYMNVRNEKLTNLTSSVKTYLFSIGKNLFREKFRNKHNRLVNLEDVSNTNAVKVEVDTDVLNEYEDTHQKEIVRYLLDEIGDPCKTLLNLMFIKGYSADSVVREMGYSDERVVRKRKSLCLKKLREMVTEKKDTKFL
ncbi:MAG: sigma-70 family RNA polymerase sigma factor [Saprospiraceae bacterium]|nr:sigma-70 family RNA polymerase sigma factor [Saprospiraceae bacterium]